MLNIVYIKLIIIASLIAMLSIARMNYDNKQSSIELPANFTSTPAKFMKIIWGQTQGLGADFSFINAISLYYNAQHATKNQNAYWNALADKFFLAQKLDPQFYDTYHIGIGTLAYDAKRPDKSIQLAYMGTEALPLNWQIPFIGGFIAHDLGHDEHNAAKLMKIASNIPKAPTMAVSLASRFLENDINSQEAIAFLRQMLHILPKEYHAGIQRRLKELQKPHSTKD